MTKSRSGTAVAAGAIAHRGGWMHRFSAKLTCSVIAMAGGSGELHCEFGARHSFRFSPTLVQITN